MPSAEYMREYRRRNPGYVRRQQVYTEVWNAAVRRLIAAHKDEFKRYNTEEREARGLGSGE